MRATRAGAAAAKSILENNLSCQLFNLMAITAGFAWEEDYKTLAPFLRSLFDKLTEFEHKKEVLIFLKNFLVNFSSLGHTFFGFNNFSLVPR